MSANVDRPTSSKYVDFQEYVDFQLRKARQQIRSTDLLTAATFTVVLVVGYLLLFVVADQWLFTGGIPTALRWGGLVVWGIALVGWIGWRLLAPMLKNVSGLFAAQEVERSEPELRSNLLNWADLQRAGRPVDPSVLRAIERQAAVRLSKIDVAQAIDHRPLLRSGYALLAVVVLFCLYAVLTPKRIGPSLARVLPLVEVSAPTRTQILEVQPGSSTVLARSRQEITVDLGGVIPESVRLVYTTADRKFRDEPVQLQPDGAAGTRFRTVLAGESGQGLLQSLSYRIEAGDAVSPTYQIQVDQPPTAKVTSVRVEPPSYTRLQPETVLGGNFTGWEGSQVAVAATVSAPIASAVIEFLDEPQGRGTGEQVPANVTNGTEVAASWKLEFREDGTFPRYYRIQCRTEDGLQDPEPIVYEYSIRRDEAPRIVLLAPERDLEVPANAVIPLLAEAADPDFELGPITLELQQAGKTIARETLSQGQKPALRLQHDLALKPLGLKAGDEITFWLEAQDNRQPRRNRKQTPPLKIRIQEPSDDKAIQEQLAEDKARQQAQLAELDREARERDPGMENERPAGDNAEPERDPAQPAPQPPNGEQPPNEDPQDAADGAGAAGGKGGESAPGEGGERQPDSSATGENNNSGKGANGQSAGEREFSPDGEDDQQVLEKLLQQGKNSPANREGEASPQAAGERQPGSEKTPNNNSKPGEEPSPSDTPKSDTDKPQPGSPMGDKPDQPPQTDPAIKPSPDGQPGASPEKSQGDDPAREPKGPGPNDQPGKAPTPKSPLESLPDGTPRDPDAGKPPKTGDKPTGDQPQGDSPQKPMPNGGGTSAGEPGEMPKPGENQNPPKTGGGQPTDKPSTDSPMPADGQPSDPKSTTPPGTSPMPGEGDPQPPQNGKNPADTQPGAKGGTPDPSMKPDQSGTPPREGDQPDNMPTNPGPKGDNSGKPQTEPRDGQPNAGDMPPQGEGRPTGQKSDQPQTGEKGGSSQAQDGSSGSRQRGPGESMQRPGEQETGASSKSSPSGAGKESDQGSSASKSGSKPGGDQPGQSTEPGKGDNGPSNAASKNEPESGKPTGDKGEPGSDEKSMKPGETPASSDGGKPDNAGGQETGSSKSGGGSKPPEGSPEAAGKEAPSGEKGSPPKPEGDANKPAGDSPSNKGPESGDQGGNKPAGQQPAGGGQPGGGKPGDGPLGNAPGEGQPGNQGGGASSTPRSGDGPRGEPAGSAPGPGDADGMAGEGAAEDPADGAGGPAPEAANLEYKKQAAELVLNKLKDGLDRGDVDPALLEELGWSKDQLERFVDRMGKALAESSQAAETPVDQARRVQFEEMLKSLDLNRGVRVRQGGDQPSREVEQIDSRRAPVPVEYRKAWEQYTKTLSKVPQPKAPKSSVPQPKSP